jgi:hypothetical protein
MIDNRKDQKDRARQALWLPQTICKFGGMAVRGLSCSDIENCRFAIMANVGGVYETEGHRICWRRFDPDAFWNRSSSVSIPKQSSGVSWKHAIEPS